jgi:peptidylprolyl isomerase/peptidyl-prolyl cis-trans isomerase B (cyclophilin B)
MANSGPDTNGSQFFIVSGPSGVGLPPKYSLFGKVVGGLDVVSAIEAKGSPSGAPKEKVVIQSVTITES